MASRAEEKQKTINGILKKSLQLFNKQGVHSISMHMIAKEVAISPGNLTYHFKLKADLVNTLVDQLEEELIGCLEKMQKVEDTSEAHVELTVVFVKVLWKYRFFFNNVTYLSGKDQQQKVRYQHLSDIVMKTLQMGYQKLIDKGSIIPVDPDKDPTLMLENFWYLMQSLLRLFAVAPTGGKTTEKNFYRFAAQHMYTYLFPYYSKKVRQNFEELMIEKLGG